jgi:3-deoxy-7-phosphoheptulonate synthase
VSFNWSPHSWKEKPEAQRVEYPDAGALQGAISRLSALPPLVTSWEIERLKSQIAEAQEGKRFLLQGGDCAERIEECRPEVIAAKLKILLQMSLVLVLGGRKPVTRVGRFAGQYAKPRSSATETRLVDGQSVTLPSYFGDLFNHPEFNALARTPDPQAMVAAYERAATTLNFIRSLCAGGFADLHHPEYWNLSFFRHATLSPQRRGEYERMIAGLMQAMEFMKAIGEGDVEDLSRVEFFTSHEGLNLNYEEAQTRQVPRRSGWYDLTTHMPWIGERTRQLDGAHVEFFRGIENPVGVKIGPKAAPASVVDLCRALNPANAPGKLVLISRMGADHAAAALPPIAAAVVASGSKVLWVCDPMHGNGMTAASGIKTRSFDAIVRELETTLDILPQHGAHLGGVHFELTGEDVTECVGGASGVTEATLDQNYVSVCDPRLNYAQALEIAFVLAGRLAAGKV